MAVWVRVVRWLLLVRLLWLWLVRRWLLLLDGRGGWWWRSGVVVAPAAQGNRSAGNQHCGSADPTDGQASATEA